MTLKFIQDIKAEINLTMPDNTSGAITPAVLRNALQDMTDSLYNRSAAIYGDHNALPVAQALTTTPTNYPNLYTNTVIPDPAVISSDLVTGRVTVNVTGFVTEMLIGFTASGANGRIVTATLYKNSVAVDRISVAATMTGAGQLHSVNIALPNIGVVAGDFFSLRLSVDVGATITFSGVRIIGRIIPTFSPV